MSKETDNENKKITIKKYNSIDDKFVDKYLREDGETIEEAKKRIKKNIRKGKD